MACFRPSGTAPALTMDNAGLERRMANDGHPVGAHDRWPQTLSGMSPLH